MASALLKPALQGGKPVRSTWLPYSCQTITEEDIAAVSKVMRDPIITRGPAVDAFERALAEGVGMPHAIAFSSATAALHATMAMYGVGPRKKLLTTPITFAATSNAALYCNGKIQFEDIDEDTMNLDPADLPISSDVAVVTAVDFAGNPCDYNAFKALQKKTSFKLVADAAHSFGGFYRGAPVGSLADATVFSFHPVKSMTTAEGGAVLVRDPEEAKYLRRFKDHGIERTSTPGFYRQVELGFNYHMTDLHAALGLSQLQRLPAMIARRTAIAEAYQDFFEGESALILPALTSESRSAWHLYPLRLRLGQLTISREDFLRALHAENIGANVHYIPVYWHPYYEKLGYKRGLCPKAEAAYEAEISLPIFPQMKSEDIRDVCTAVEKLLSVFSKP